MFWHPVSDSQAPERFLVFNQATVLSQQPSAPSRSAIMVYALQKEENLAFVKFDLYKDLK